MTKAFPKNETYGLILQMRRAAFKGNDVHLRALFERSSDVIIILDRFRLIIECNPAFVTQFGYLPEEAVGQSVRLIHPSEESFIEFGRLVYPIIEQSDSWRGEWMLCRKDGGIALFEASLSVIKNDEGTIEGYVAMIRDITDRKAAEKGLRDSEQRYRELLNSVSDMVYTQDLEGRFTSVNTSGSIILGYSREEFIGHKASEFMKPIFQEAFEIEYLGRLKTIGQDQGTSLYFHKGGNRRYLEYRSRLVRTPDGRSFISGSARDVTNRILQEKRLKQLQEQLIQAQRLEALGTLAGGVAHNFNNLLTGIQGRTSLMLMECNCTHQNYEHLKDIEEYVKSAATLTKQLLGFARGGKYEVLPTDLNELVKKTSEMFFRTQKEIVFFLKLQEDLWAVAVDRGQIEQVLMNLYVNAWQAMPGGGSIYLETSNVFLDEDQIKPYDLNPGRYLQVSVRDTGVGMDEKTKQRIFDPFFTTKKMDRGIGLGLSSSYGIIKNHSGMIRVFSRQGEGTTFQIHLPASEKKAVKEVESTLKISPGSETILLVDDEQMILQVGREMLEKMGYKVLPAENGLKALKIYEKERDNIDLVLLDMIMPRLSGGETFSGLKKLKQSVKVLLSSGYSLNDQSQDILEQGCSGFIQKPFSITQLSLKLREILDPEKR